MWSPRYWICWIIAPMSDLFEIDRSRRYMAQRKSTTTLVATGGNSNSLRTTVPMWIVQQFELESGGKIEWDLKVENNRMTITVNPVE